MVINSEQDLFTPTDTVSEQDLKRAQVHVTSALERCREGFEVGARVVRVGPALLHHEREFFIDNLLDLIRLNIERI